METQNSRQMPFAFSFAAIIIIIAGVMYASSIVIPLLIALFISIISARPIMWLQNKKVPQGLAIAIIFISVIVIFLSLGKLIGTSLSSFTENTQQYEDSINAMGGSILQFFSDKGINLEMDKMSKIIDPAKIMNVTAGFLGELGSFMGNALTVFFLALFLLLELDSFPIKLKAIMKGSPKSFSYLHVITESVRHYLSIKTITSLITGVLIWVAMAIIGLDYAIIWGLIAFLLNYIPNIGSIIAALPAVIFALLQLGFGGALWTTGVFLAVNMIIGNAIEPKIMGKGLGLSTFVVFLSLIFWGFMLGTVGMFLSVPLTMTIKIMLEQNPKTEWIAIILGTQEEAEVMIDKNSSSSDNE